MIHVKKGLTIFSLVLLLFSLVGCADNKTAVTSNRTELANEYKLKIMYQDKIIEPVRGSSTWTIVNTDGTSTTISNDYAAAPELVKNSTPLIVSPRETLTLSFTNKPQNVIVNIWKDNNPIQQEITDNKILIPELKGSIIYEVITNWGLGTVRYAFLANVN